MLINLSHPCLLVSVLGSLETVWPRDLLLHQTHWEMASGVPSFEILLVLKLVVNSSQK